MESTTEASEWPALFFPSQAQKSYIEDFNEKLRINSAKILGKLQGTITAMNEADIIAKKTRLEQELYNETHGKFKYSKNGIMTYILEHPEIIMKIQELMVIHQKLMGEGRDTEYALPYNVNSYILVLASLMVEDAIDLTYGVSNVSDNELMSYFRDHRLGGGKKSKRSYRKNIKRKKRTYRTKKYNKRQQKTRRN